MSFVLNSILFVKLLSYLFASILYITDILWPQLATVTGIVSACLIVKVTTHHHSHQSNLIIEISPG